MKNFAILVLFVLVAVSAQAGIWFLQVPKDEAASMAQRLDYLKPNSPYTLRYTEAIYAPSATVTTALVPIDERAQAELTAEEWDAKLASMPVEFIPPMPSMEPASTTWGE